MITMVITALALLVGAFIGLCGFGLSFALMIHEQSKRFGETLRSEMRAEQALRKLAETERDGLKQAVAMQAEAIEKGALPWFARSDKLDARIESEALDRAERPDFYADVVEGLGGTR